MKGSCVYGCHFHVLGAITHSEHLTGRERTQSCPIPSLSSAERYIARHTGMEGCSVVIKNKARLNSAAPFTFKDKTRDTGFLLSKEQGLAATSRMEVLGWYIDQSVISQESVTLFFKIEFLTGLELAK